MYWWKLKQVDFGCEGKSCGVIEYCNENAGNTQQKSDSVCLAAGTVMIAGGWSLIVLLLHFVNSLALNLP